MKKSFIIIINLIMIMLIGCSKDIIMSIDQVSYYLQVGEQIELNIEVHNYESPTFNYEVDVDGIIQIDNNIITAMSEGIVVVKISLAENSSVAPIEIVIDVEQLAYIEIESDTDTLECKQTLQLTLKKINVEGKVKWSSENEDVAIVSISGLVVAKDEGTTVIKATCGSYVDEFILTVTKPLATELIVEDITVMEVNSSYELNCSILPSLASQKFKVTSSDSNIIEVNENVLIAKAMGEAIVTVETVDGTNLSKNLKITVIENAAPIISCDDSKITISWNDTEAVFKGMTATDNCDGDITDCIKVTSDFNCQEYGLHTVDYAVVDRAGNETTYTREIEVVWNYTVKFIAHAGSYFGVANSEESIRYALEELQYQAVEVDLKQTKDGVFVLSHDTIITISNGTKIDISETTWDELKNYTITETRNDGYPKQFGMITNGTYTSKICTLETYLNICKEYNALAVIELKTSTGISNYSQHRMQALMDQIEAQGMLKNVIFLTSSNKCLQWVKTNGYEYIECQYLVGSCEDQAILDECIQYGFTVSINVTDYSNNDEWLTKYKEAGIKISTYTFSQWNPYSQVQQWIDKGVDYVTCDWHLMSELKLPVNTEETE